jgi:hypothetical protein
VKRYEDQFKDINYLEEYYKNVKRYEDQFKDRNEENDIEENIDIHKNLNRIE